MPREQGPVHNLFRSGANLLATMLAIAQTRLELLTTELQEEVHRAAEILMLMLVVLVAAGLGLFMTALVIIFVLWDTHRLLASVMTTGFFFVIALLAGVVLRAKIKSKPRMLDATIAELAKDRQMLARRRAGAGDETG
jgi:uncharacterized membrane protein YqjE